MFWREKPAGRALLGKWMGRFNGEPIAMEFHKGGRLAYVALSPRGPTQIMRLTWRVEGDDLITDQPSHPDEQRTKFSVSGDVLSLTLAGHLTELRREAR